MHIPTLFYYFLQCHPTPFQFHFYVSFYLYIQISIQDSCEHDQIMERLKPLMEEDPEAGWNELCEEARHLSPRLPCLLLMDQPRPQQALLILELKFGV